MWYLFPTKTLYLADIMGYKAYFKEILKENGINGKEFSEIFGIGYDYYRKSTQNKGNRVKNWMRSFIIGYELGKKNGEKRE